MKYAVDTVLLSLLSGPSHHHSLELHEFVEWCDKTKEMVVTFSSKQRELAVAAVSTIHRRNVELVENHKYLGNIFDGTFKFASNSRRCSGDAISGGIS